MRLKSHKLNLVLLQPQIAPNTGNVARLCVATGTELHLVRPFGFDLSDRNLRRSAMDYWERLKLVVHEDEEAFLRVVGTQRMWLFTSKGERSLWDAEFGDGDWLVFGNETRGIREEIRESGRDWTVRI